MVHTSFSTTTELSLDVVIEHLQRKPNVEGLVLIGSGKSDHFEAASDYDLLIVVVELPVAMRVGITSIDHRLSDLLFATVTEIDTILTSDQPFTGEEWLGRIIRWCQSGRILFDRSTRLSRLKQKVNSGNWIRPPNELHQYQTWFGINYNFVQTSRMSRSLDPIYHLAVRMRLLYSLSDILNGYFQLRQIPWPGEKAAIHYLTTHDPKFLTLFSESMQESDFESLLDRYERLVVMAIAPYGGLWEDNVTAFQLDENTLPSQHTAQEALRWWHSLMGDGFE